MHADFDNYRIMADILRWPLQDLQHAADLTAERVGKADCHQERGSIYQKQRNYNLAAVEYEVAPTPH